MGETIMAAVKQDARRVVVELTQVELNAVLVQPAKDRGFIDFDPTRISTRQVNNDTFEIVYERVEGTA